MNLPTPLHYHAFALFALASFCFAPHSAQALLIDFNSYATGNLEGKPATGTQWSGGTSNFIVTSGAGVAGSNAVVTAARSSGSATTTFTPSETDLPGFNGTSSILTVSFSFRFTDLPSSATDTVAAIQFGWDGADANTAARFYIRADGRLGYNSGSSAILVTGLTLGNTTTWTTVTATLNYATQKYTFSINGNPYSTAGGTSEFNFRGATDASVLRLTDSGSANFRGVAFDNISYTVVPEPSTAALLITSTAVGGLMLRKRLKR